MTKMKRNERKEWLRTWKKEIDSLQKAWEPISIKVNADLNISNLTRAKLRRADSTLSVETLLHIYQQLLWLVSDRLNNSEEETLRVLRSLERIIKAMPEGT